MFNQNPTGNATAVLAATAPNTSYIIYEANLLQGFYDPDSDTLNVTSLSAENGEITDLGNGQWQFVPVTNFYGTVALNYLVSDKKGGDTQGALSFNIVAPQTVPVQTMTGISIKEIAPKTGDTLHVVNTINDALGVNNVKYEWQNQPIHGTNWNVIEGATLNTYQVDEALNGTIRVEVTYTEESGKKITLDSTSVAIAAGVSVSYNTPDTEVGTVLIAHLNDPEGVNQVTYQWIYDDGTKLTNAIAKDAKHPNADQYTVTQGDSGHSIHVEVIYKNG